MNTQVLMSLSALFLAILGIGGSFLPQEILAHFGEQTRGLAVLLIQVTGASYLGFAILNWMARAVLIGGIYARPVAVGNFLHFAVVALTLGKAIAGGGPRGAEIIAACAASSVFAVWFGLVVFTSPAQKKT
jgi:hypothetical protein